VRFCFFLLAVLGMALCGTRLEAQGLEPHLPAPGVLGFRVGGLFSVYDARFGHPTRAAETGRQPLTNELFVERIDDVVFAPLLPLRTQLSGFFAADADAPEIEPGSLFLDVDRLRTRADHRTVPFEVSLGVLPRLSVAVRVPLAQYWLSVTGFQVADGNVGWNPDQVGNAALLAQVDTALATLGRNPFLPTRGSVFGAALQERVRQATGGRELQLPAAPLAFVGRQGVRGAETIRAGGHDPARPAWELGDAEVRVAARLLWGGPAAEPPAAVGLTIRAVAEVALRLPTGRPPDEGYLALPRPEQGLGGVAMGLHGAVDRAPFGVAASLQVQRLGGVEFRQRIWPAAATQPADAVVPRNPAAVLTGRWEAGTRLGLELRPYLHLADEIRLATVYGLRQRRGQQFSQTGGGEPPLSGGETETAQVWGVGAEFSTVGPYQAGRADVPFVAGLLFRNSFAGSGGAPADRTLEMYGQLFIRAWGGR
jgi:hypothetical protein